MKELKDKERHKKLCKYQEKEKEMEKKRIN
jgi:hypothetical protein